MDNHVTFFFYTLLEQCKPINVLLYVSTSQKQYNTEMEKKVIKAHFLPAELDDILYITCHIQRSVLNNVYFLNKMCNNINVNQRHHVTWSLAVLFLRED